MNKAYHETLPKNYFYGLYQKVSKSLNHGENVCISVLYGCGVKTSFNFLYNHLKKSKNFEAIDIYDPEIKDLDLVTFVSKVNRKKSRLIIIRFFENLKNKREVLEKIDSFRRPNPASLVFLVIADHTAITEPENYTAISTVFFSDIIYLTPYSYNQTILMIGTLTSYYGWSINKNLHKKIFILSGGVPRFIKYLCKEVSESFNPIDNLEKIILSPQINFQLELMVKLLITMPSKKLQILGIVDNKNTIKSKLLKYYYNNYRSPIITNLYPKLTESESKLLTYILVGGGVVSIDKIADLIKMSDEDFSLWAIYKLISRLKPKIKNNFKIKNLKGKGYYLEKVT